MCALHVFPFGTPELARGPQGHNVIIQHVSAIVKLPRRAWGGGRWRRTAQLMRLYHPLFPGERSHLTAPSLCHTYVGVWWSGCDSGMLYVMYALLATWVRCLCPQGYKYSRFQVRAQCNGAELSGV